MVDGGCRRVLISVALACTWSSAALAEDHRRHRCAAVPDDLGRLACYDAEFGRPESTATQAAQPRLVPQVEAVAASGAEVDFGLSKWAKRNLDPTAAKAQPQRITARIRQVERQRDGRFLVTLENEQVWLQVETMSRARVAVGDEVTIREASLGSFLLVTANQVATRVRRLR